MKKNQFSEVLILAVLAVVLIVYCSYTYLIKPLQTETASLEQQVQQKEMSLRTLNTATYSYSANLEKLTAYSKGLENCKDDFFSDEFEEVYIDHVKVNMYDHNIDFTSLNASDSGFRASAVYPSANAANRMLAVLSEDSLLADNSMIAADSYNSYVEALKASGGRFENEFAMTSISLSVEGYYNDVLAFLKGLIDNDKHVIINSVTLEIGENAFLNASENPSVLVRMEVLFPRVPKINSLCTVEVPDPLPPYAFPEDINNGSYKKNTSFLAGILDMLS